jgi:hypothetical protein
MCCVGCPCHRYCMAHLVNWQPGERPKYCNNRMVSYQHIMSIFPPSCLPHSMLFDAYTQRVRRSWLLGIWGGVYWHATSEECPAGWHSYVQSCCPRIKEWTKKWLLLDPWRGPEYQDLLQVFFLSTTHLLMRVLVLTTVVPIHIPSYYSMISLLRGEWRNLVI